MREAAVQQAGFYPIPPEVCELIPKHLTLGFEASEVTILDPCAGKGEALKMIADRLAIPAANRYAIELDTVRAEHCRDLLGKEQVLGPCSIQSAAITYNAFSIIYLNPPFDNELGGTTRDEVTFLNLAKHWLAPGGILIFVLPLTVVYYNGNRLRKALDAHFEHVTIFTFPEEHRHHREFVIIGRKAKVASKDRFDVQSTYFDDVNCPVGSTEDDWIVPKGTRPKRFFQLAHTDEQLLEALNKSPLIELLKPQGKNQKKRPPLPLSPGHRGMAMVAGEMDGLYVGPNERFVLCSRAEKVPHVKNVTENFNDDGEHTSTTTLIVEKFQTTTSILGPDGRIKRLVTQA